MQGRVSQTLYLMSVSLLDNFSHYLRAQASHPENDRPVRPLAITISREAGAGAVTVAELVRQRLTAAETVPSSSPWAVFDANLAKQVLKDHQLPPDLARFVAEDARLPVEAIVEEILGLHPSDWTLVQQTTPNDSASGWHRPLHRGRARRKYHYCAFSECLPRPIGGAAGDANSTFRRVLASSRSRGGQVSSGADQARSRYLRRYFDAEIDEPTLYDVTLNSGRMGFVRAAEVIA